VVASQASPSLFGRAAFRGGNVLVGERLRQDWKARRQFARVLVAVVQAEQ
jgi:hypothetical protein